MNSPFTPVVYQHCRRSRRRSTDLTTCPLDTCLYLLSVVSDVLQVCPSMLSVITHLRVVSTLLITVHTGLFIVVHTLLSCAPPQSASSSGSVLILLSQLPSLPLLNHSSPTPLKLPPSPTLPCSPVQTLPHHHQAHHQIPQHQLLPQK